jgi:hypothetical protein
MTRKARLGDEEDLDFELDYWLQFTPEERLEAIWQATLDWAAMKGLDESQLRLQRTVRGLKRG